VFPKRWLWLQCNVFKQAAAAEEEEEEEEGEE
jgi:hypothetical protein